MKKYEIIERAGAWIVEDEGVEVARYEQQALALNDVSRRLADGDHGEVGVSFALRYQAR